MQRPWVIDGSIVGTTFGLVSSSLDVLKHLLLEKKKFFFEWPYEQSHQRPRYFYLLDRSAVQQERSLDFDQLKNFLVSWRKKIWLCMERKDHARPMPPEYFPIRSTLGSTKKGNCWSRGTRQQPRCSSFGGQRRRRNRAKERHALHQLSSVLVATERFTCSWLISQLIEEQNGRISREGRERVTE